MTTFTSLCEGPIFYSYLLPSYKSHGDLHLSFLHFILWQALCIVTLHKSHDVLWTSEWCKWYGVGKVLKFSKFLCFNIFLILHGFWTIFKIPRFLLLQGNIVLYFCGIWVSYCPTIKKFLYFSKWLNCTGHNFFSRELKFPPHIPLYFCGIWVSYCPIIIIIIIVLLKMNKLYCSDLF